jgi:hypothetical protein
MAMPILQPAAQELYDKLEPFQYDEANHDYALAKFCSAVGSILEEIESYVRDGADGEPGWSILLDINRAPLKGLAWLAQFVGVTLVPQLPTETQAQYDARSRARILSTDGWRRGTPDSLRGAAAQWLTGTKTVIFRERWPDAYSLTVVTYTSQTPDQAKVLASLLEQKPAGLVLTYNVLAGQDYQSLYANHATYQNVFTSYATYQGLVTDQPGT